MEKIIVDKSFFNIKNTLECGQIFRFAPYKNGYLVCSLNKACYCYETDTHSIIECNEIDRDYFYNFFDLGYDYSIPYNQAISFNIPFLTKAANYGKGIRILRQDSVETLFSFVISQNNNINRIKGIIDRLCHALGEVIEFAGQTLHAFPTAQIMASQPLEFYKSIGLGYRAEYVYGIANAISKGLYISKYKDFSTKELKNQLVAIKGVGPKVADCVTLFGFHKGDSFPVDTWIEKLYKTDFSGELTDRNKIADWFVGKFGFNSGIFQQYMFHYKRMVQKSDEN